MGGVLGGWAEERRGEGNTTWNLVDDFYTIKTVTVLLYSMEIPVAAFKPKELLDHLLEANTLTENQLDEFMQANQVEGQYHEYKSGIITTPSERDKGRRIIREYVSGFANSDGGVLLIGVDESQPRKIVSCEAFIGNSPLEEWSSRCLQGMVGYFSPQPRFQVIQHSEGSVLAISVARAPSLIPCVESREMKYFLRIGDSTLQVPEYLIADLVLGRRQHPLLDVHDPQINKVKTEILVDHRKDRPPITRTSFSFTVENLSLVTAEGFEVGVVSWSLNDNEREINKHLRSHLDVIPMPQGPHYYKTSVQDLYAC